ncbi:MAG: hypothetical protein E7224_01145 [Clostridiales bacterium]|nr:hypothetical protein [Clostridiales bacterium]
MTERENMLKVLRHEKPDWVPNFGATAAFIYSYGCDRRLDPATGYYKDPFGVKFLLEGGPLSGFMPANTSTGDFELDDVTEWKKMMPKLDLGKVDWKAETERMINSSRTMYGSVGEDRVFNYVAGYL